MVYLWLALGFVLLVKGADRFVSGASEIAKKLKIPAVIIGLTVVAFGTSAPEMAVSITAAIQGRNEIALGNVVGSNIFNLLVVLGVSGMICLLTVNKSMLKRDFPLSIGATAILGALAFLGIQKNTLSRLDGFMMLGIFAGYMVILCRNALKNCRNSGEGSSELSKESGKSIGIDAAYSVFGLVCIILGGNLVVDSASEIARSFGVSENLIALTIVAIGTSLPELVTSVAAAVKKENDIAIGNVIGSNIFNILCILGASAAIHPIQIEGESYGDILFCFAVSLICFLYVLKSKSIGRIAGGIMLLGYAGYTAFLLVC